MNKTFSTTQEYIDTVVKAREYLDPEDVELVIWHGGCTDGFAAAYSAWKYALGTGLEFRGESYLKEGEKRDFGFLEGKNVLIVDFSYPRDVMELVQKLAKRVLVLDHHKTAMKNLSGLEGIFFEYADLNDKAVISTWTALGLD
jgi:hypothetical protein